MMRTIVLSLALLLVGLASAARAQDDALKARNAFGRGVAAFTAGKYGDALDAFTEAYRAKPNPVVLFNIGQAEAELGRAASATAHFEQYLREAKNVPPERRAEVKRQVARLKKMEAQLV